MGNCGGGTFGLFILSAETQPEPCTSASILFLRISSTMSDILIHSIAMGSGCSPGLSYTVSSISFALSTSILWYSLSHRSVRVTLVRATTLSSTLTATNVSGPLVNRPVVAWSTSLTATTRIAS